MALLNFYTVVRQQILSQDEWLYTIRLNPDCEVYKGHFPNQPVAPGVCQLQAVKECAEAALGRPLRITHLKQCKFLRIIIPSECPELDIYLRIDAENKFQAQVRDENTVYAKISAQIE